VDKRIEPIVEINHVSKILKEIEVVQDINLQVYAGEVVALCGANGAGKSTLIRIMTGIMQPSQGTIRIQGLEWRNSRRDYANQIGYMPDDYRFSNSLTARETLAFWASLRGISNERVEQLLIEVGLAETGKKSVSSFSKGMRQRILFAQAMLASPPVLILDEPTNGLDPYWMESFIMLIRKVKKEGQTVIFSTHQLQIAESLADRIVFMNQGKIALNETIENMRRRQGGSGLQEALAGIYGLSQT
jgi:ABC-type multidrug transport system ATPase subunit